MFTSAAILPSYFGEERSGGGGGYSWSYTCICRVGGATGPQNAWGILRVNKKFEGSVERIYPIFLLVRLPYRKVQRHTLYINYLISYCRKYTLQYFLFEQTPMRPI